MDIKNYIKKTVIAIGLLLLLGLSCKNDLTPNQTEALPLVAVTDSVAVVDSAKIASTKVEVLKDNLLDRMASRAQLSKFVLALQETKIDSILKTQDGPFTVFALMNPDSMTLSKKWNQNSAPDWPASYIIKGAYSTPSIYKSFSSLRPQTTFKTLNEKEFTLYSLRDTLFIKGNKNSPKAYVYSSDLVAGNGIVHLVKLVSD